MNDLEAKLLTIIRQYNVDLNSPVWKGDDLKAWQDEENRDRLAHVDRRFMVRIQDAFRESGWRHVTDDAHLLDVIDHARSLVSVSPPKESA